MTWRAAANTPNSLAPTIPETVYMMFQMTFAIITPALIAGSFAERMKFSAMLWFIGLWAIFVYAPVAHWVWGPDGFMSAVNVDAKGNFQGVVPSPRLRRRNRRPYQRGRRRTRVVPPARQAQGAGTGPQHGPDLHRRGPSVGRLVRLQRRLGSERGLAGRHGDDGHADRDRGRGADLDVRRMGATAASRPSSASARARSPASSPSRRLRASSARSERW